MEFEILTTERLLLKKLTPEGFAWIFENLSKEEIKKELGLSADEEFETEKKKNTGGYKTYNKSIVHFKLILKETNEVIGGAGFHNWYFDHFRAELGYALTKDEYKRKGLMGEAVSTILNYGFNQMNLNRVEACISPANDASLALIKKFNFTQEGYLKQHYVRNGEVQDTIIFSLLKEEYQKTNS
ncbi:MAG: alanine acetyltransferase [Bacteroidota bacterium]|jgi:ribosomal-protein-alanine N-acetyltransferase|nr:alanine acetyltransferase [Bacteroidota bacterium]